MGENAIARSAEWVQMRRARATRVVLLLSMLLQALRLLRAFQAIGAIVSLVLSTYTTSKVGMSEYRYAAAVSGLSFASQITLLTMYHYICRSKSFHKFSLVCDFILSILLVCAAVAVTFPGDSLREAVAAFLYVLFGLSAGLVSLDFAAVHPPEAASEPDSELK